MTLIRESVPLPPPGWRKAIPLSVKRAVRQQQDGKCAASGEPLDGAEIHYDHRPPLHQREYDAAADDTIPPANDPRFIEAVIATEHRKRTSSDLRNMGKERRLRAAKAALDDAMRRTCGQKRLPKGTIRAPRRRRARDINPEEFGL